MNFHSRTDRVVDDEEGCGVGGNMHSCPTVSYSVAIALQSRPAALLALFCDDVISDHSHVRPKAFFSFLTV